MDFNDLICCLDIYLKRNAKIYKISLVLCRFMNWLFYFNRFWVFQLLYDCQSGENEKNTNRLSYIVSQTLYSQMSNNIYIFSQIAVHNQPTNTANVKRYIKIKGKSKFRWNRIYLYVFVITEQKKKHFIFKRKPPLRFSIYFWWKVLLLET